MAEAKRINEPGEAKFTASAALASGEVIQLADGRAAVVAGLTGFSSGDKAVAYTDGRYAFAAASATTFAIGDPVYWDISANLAINAPGDADDIYLGTCAVAKTSGQTEVQVDMGTAARGLGRATWSSRAVEIDHADTGSFNLIAAADNPVGLAVESFVGLVTEAPVGSSEDQLVITLYDEDDNALATMTTTDTTPDAIGDIIQGTPTIANAATGTVMAIIPAEKAAYAKVSQATAGTPAGKIKVRVTVSPFE